MRRPGRKWKIALAFLVPELILLVSFVFAPIIGTVYMSFKTEEGGLGLDNYRSVISEKSPDKALLLLNNMPRSPPWGALVHNIVWMAIHLPLVVFLGLFLAYLLREVYGRSVVKSVIFLGMVIPMVVGGLIIRFMFDEYIGLVPKLLAGLGVEGVLAKTWTNYPQTALLALILGSVWLWTGFSMTVYSAALESIPPSYIEAARVDGASGLQVFFRIVVPMLRNATIIVVVMTMLWDLKIFDVVYVSTLGGPGGSSNVMALVMYTYFARALDYGSSSAVAVLLTLLTLVPGIWFVRVVTRRGKA